MSTKKLSTTKQGFTIIEVVLVLAIAGLIFLMVFVALPALQRSQRDTQRREDVSKVAAAINTYKTNTGSLPIVPSSNTVSTSRVAWKGIDDFSKTDCIQSGATINGAAVCAFIKNYLSTDVAYNTFKSPSGQFYTLLSYNGLDFLTANNNNTKKYNELDNINIIYKAKCDPTNSNNLGITSAQSGYAITTPLENGGRYCVDSGNE